MPLETSIRGAVSGLGAEVDSSGNQLVKLPLTPANMGGLRVFSEEDSGEILGDPSLLSPEVDGDYRWRTASDLMLDNEILDYTAQNTGKHIYGNTTMTMAWAVGGLSTNASGITTTTTGARFATRAFFPIMGSASVYCESAVAFDASATSNTIIDWGLFLDGAANPFAPTDGVYFRLNSSGLQGVANFNGSEISTGVFPTSSTDADPFVYTLNKKYQFIITITQRGAEFWIDNVKYGELAIPAGQGQICASAALPFAMRHAIVGGAAGAVLRGVLSYYAVSLGGPTVMTTASIQGQRLHGSYQGLSGGTMGSLVQSGTITTGNAADPTAAVPTTTTAALGTGLGGVFRETATLAVNTDAIIDSFQVPAGAVSVPGRRLVIRGLYLSSFVSTVVVGGPNVRRYFLAFGHTAVSLATAEAATTKAPRRIYLPFLQTVTAAQAVSTLLDQKTNFVDFGDAPVYVNPGEFVALCVRKTGTVETSGEYTHMVTPVYGWE